MSDIIFLRVALIVSEMGLKWPVSLLEYFDVQDGDLHRLYEFQLLMRDDVDTTDFAVEFHEAMEHHNKISPVKADFHELTECPSPVKNAHIASLTVTTI